MIGDKLQIYTFEYLMRTALSYIPDTVDKREGSIIYDALAPFCQVLAGAALQLQNFYRDTYVLTATGQELDYRVAEQGITRYPATVAIKKGYFADANESPMNIPLGSRFSTVSDTSPLNYYVSAEYKEDGVAVPGTYELTCEKTGTLGNEYSGNLINITFIQGLSIAQMSSLIQPARDTETDEQLRDRYLERLNQKAFGGNIADYKQKVKEINGVGAVQVYPTWNGGGTVKISILDSEYNPCTDEFITKVQEEIDPENMQGETGLGLGIAPIGHKVTVSTAEKLSVNISADIQLQPGYDVGQVKPLIQNALSDYIDETKLEWDKMITAGQYMYTIYISKIISVILSVSGIVNVRQVSINNEYEDLELVQSAETQTIAELGDVIVNV